MKLNEQTVKALPVPDKGNRVTYFAGAVLQGTQVPSGFGCRVTAGGVRSFVMNYRVDHVERRFTIGTYPDWSVLQAVKEARTLRQRIDRGEDPMADRRKVEAAASNTVKAICEEYLGRAGKELRTAEWRKQVFERLVYPELGAKDIGSVKRSDIVRLLDKVEDENGAVMADRTLAIVRKVMNWHASRSDDFRSPIVRGMARTKPKERARERTLTDAELQAVWKACSGPFGAFVRFTLLTGARRSEAAEMALDELGGASWTLPAARNKTKVDLLRPLSQDALAVLPDRSDGCAFVFTTDGKTPISGFSKFKAALDKASGVTDWTIHDLRRTARTLLSRAGVATDIAEQCLGHVLPGVRGVYDRHGYEAEKRLAYEALAALIGRIVDPPADNVGGAAGLTALKSDGKN